MSLLKDGGRLGYITMNSFFKSLNGRALRDYFSRNKFIFRIVDFGSNQVFQSNNTYTCLCFLEKKKQSYLEFTSATPNSISNIKYAQLSYDDLDDFKGWNLKVPKVVNQIESIGVPFSSVYKTSSGVATLKNDVYIFDSTCEDDVYFYIDEHTPIEKNVCRKIINSNRLTKVSNLDEIKREIIFPYEYEGNFARILSEDTLKNLYPKAYAYLSSKRGLLATRDKGNGNYETWYAYGRNQSLVKYKYKLFFPHIASSSPNFIISKDESLLFYNGLCLLDNDLLKIKVAQKIMGSRLFWYYIENTSKTYGSGFMSLSKNYIKSFGILALSDSENNWLVSETDKSKIDSFLAEKYQISDFLTLK